MSEPREAEKLRFGLIGGGEGAFIGQVHRLAAELDGEARLVCGAFSADPQRALRSGQSLYRLPAERCYGSYDDMFARERALPESERMQFVIIATPNHLHYAMASAALKSGYHVVCDKPVTHDLSQALSLQSEVSQAGLEFALTHNYTGYPMVREARELVRGGTLGQLRRVDCSYLQGWLAQPQKHSKQAEWRTDPARAGAAGCFGDIGSHAENLVSFVTGLEIESLCADLSTFVDGRRLDDDGNVLLRFHGGARGTISASQIAAGKENDLSLKVFGEHGGLEWAQADPNTLTVRWADKPIEVRRTAGPGVSAVSASAARVPAGHPEGYLEAFAEIYRNFYGALRGLGSGDFPRIADGVRGLRFIDSVVASSAAGGVWRELEEKQ